MPRVNQAALLGGVATVLYAAVVLGGGVFGAPLRLAVDDLGNTLVAIVSGILCLAAGQTQLSRRSRLSWMLIGLSLCCWALGDAYWAWTELVLSQSTATPSLADIAYLAAAPLIFSGILLRPTLRRRPVSRWLLLIDVGLTLAALLAVAWVLAIGPCFSGWRLIRWCRS